MENIRKLKEVVDLNTELGRGSYGVVKKVSFHGINCAAKDIHGILIECASDKQFQVIKKNFLEECVKCNKLFHPNIVQFLGIHYPTKQARLPWLVMELMDCSLTNFIENHDKESVSLFIKASIFCDISLGLQFLHTQDIIHRDLSSNNVLLTKHLTAKISDLGQAKLVNPGSSKSHSKVPGAQIFLPPEVISDADKARYGKPIDVFSLGCIMIHVAAHKWPNPLPEIYYDTELEKKVALSEIERRKEYLSEIKELKDLNTLITDCLHDNPKRRPIITKIVGELDQLKFSYQKNSIFAGNKINAVEFEKHLKKKAVEFEKHLKLQDKEIAEQLLEIKKLNKLVQEAHKQMQVRIIISVT